MSKRGRNKAQEAESRVWVLAVVADGFRTVATAVEQLVSACHEGPSENEIS